MPQKDRVPLTGGSALFGGQVRVGTASSTRNTTSRHLGDQRTRHQPHHDDHHGSSRSSSSSSSAHRDPAGFSLLSGATSRHRTARTQPQPQPQQHSRSPALGRRSK
ncbi:unnamed protein product [Arctogadus glacialis]